nr:Haloacetate dehalogenase H-1 [Klebsiella pneumoniae]
MNGFIRPSLAPRCAGTISGDGLPVVFIHGLGCASSYDYPRIASDPALRERRKILIDLPGFGYSDKPRVFSYNIHEQALVLEQFLSHLRLQRFALFGHSMGGSIAIEAAGLLGERVTTLLVSEPNLFAGGGEYSRRIAAQSESAFVADGYASCWRRSARRGRVVYKTAPLGRLAGRLQPDTRQRHALVYPAMPAALPENADRRRTVAPLCG